MPHIKDSCGVGNDSDIIFCAVRNNIENEYFNEVKSEL
jgi:hypothetical protein